MDDIAVRLDLPPASGTSVSGKVYLPKSGSLGTIPYDANGQLTQDGLWDYTWDGAGRLVAMEHRDTEITDPTERMRIEFRYDFMGRRIEKAVYPGASGGGYSSTADSITRFIYDGWLLMAELDGKNSNALIRSYTWSRDISGTRSGAAGIGGLTLIYDASSGESYYPMYDPQHNLIGLVEADSGEIAARYEYGPFGEIIRVSGDAIAKEQPFGFSTKYTDRESGLVYYGYRYYQPLYARWLSRDPLGVNGGMNVYGFVGNNPLMFVDPLGLEEFDYTDLWMDADGNVRKNGCDEIIRKGEGIPKITLAEQIEDQNTSLDPSSLTAGALAGDSFDNFKDGLVATAQFGADMTPQGVVVGTLTGRRIYDDSEVVPWWERGLNVVGSAGKGVGLAAGAFFGLKHADELVDGGRAVGKLDCIAPNATRLLSSGPRYNPWSGPIRSVKAERDVLMYRVWGGDAEKLGGWLSPTRPASSLSAIRDLALPPAWNP